jgi:hypothetical protein
MGADGDVLGARGDTKSRLRARHRWTGEAMTVQDGLDIQVPQPTLLFDLDGTLVDSVYQHVIAWQETLATCGIELSVCADPPPDRHERRAVHRRAQS